MSLRNILFIIAGVLMVAGITLVLIGVFAAPSADENKNACVKHAAEKSEVSEHESDSNRT